MNLPRIISRWFHHDDLPPIEEAENAARAAKRPWSSQEAYDAFASVDETQGAEERQHA